MPVISPPVLNVISRGNAFAKSLAGETTLAAMLTASVATTAVNIEMAMTSGELNRPIELDRIPDHLAVDDRRRARDQHAHRREHEHRRRQRHDLADDLLALAAAEAREVGHVERQRRPEADHRGERREEHRQELAERLKLARLRRAAGRSRSPRVTAHASSSAGHHEHERRGPVLDGAQQVHAAIDDRDVEAPEEQERQPLGRRVTAEAGAEQVVPVRE